MTRLLGIETSSEMCSVAVSDGDAVTCRDQHQPRGHAELILPAVRELLSGAGLKLTDLDAIAYGRGPGSFTSLRIGIGVVQGLAWGANIGVVPVSSLAALAQGVATRERIPAGTTIVAAVDARMNEVFHATFKVNETGKVILQDAESVDSPAVLNPPAGAGLLGVGNGFARYAELETVAAACSEIFDDEWPSARDLIPLAHDWLAEHPPLEAHLAQPVYVRDRVAEKPKSGG